VHELSNSSAPHPDRSDAGPLVRPTRDSQPVRGDDELRESSDSRDIVERRRYHAFISYSHAADGKLAPELHSALQRFAKPWYRRRAVHIFRDKTSLSATPSLWPTIETGLAASEHFVLLASPEAARSRWVQQEVDWWLAHRSPQQLLIVLTAGRLLWDEKMR
jgi:MTH538 TIR-like domain (DUF1863)